jgi:hypothetical protein
LRRQIGFWASNHPERQVDMSDERSLPKIRKLLQPSGAVLVDATEDPSQATDAFLQAVARLGAAAVAMYTDMMHDDLELFVRVRGSQFILGPLLGEQWDDFFERFLGANRTVPASRGQAPQRSAHSDSREHGGRRRELFINRFRANRHWLFTDTN